MIKAVFSLYRPSYIRGLVRALENRHYNLVSYLGWYWTTADFSDSSENSYRPSVRSRWLVFFLWLGIFLEILLGLVLISLWRYNDLTGGLASGLATIIAYPVVWAHLVIIPVSLAELFGLPKILGKKVVLAILTRQVKKLRSRNDFKIIAVAGSVGKTSTKFAIAQVLGTKLKVRWQQGNYNDIVSVPLVFFDEAMPNLLNVPAWLKIFRRNHKALRREYQPDVVVLELGTDGMGQILEFAKYLRADIGIVTAIAPEHMEYFENLDNVAREELSLAKLSNKLLVNSDLCSRDYLDGLENIETYGFETADWLMDNIKFRNKKYSFAIKNHDQIICKSNANLLSKNHLYSLLVATAVAKELGLDDTEITEALKSVAPAPGRLQPLDGIKKSTILDDSYNSAPEAAIVALDTLYNIKAPQKIAILGSMNELGDYSEEAHRLVGEYCDPKKLDMVVTIGNDAEKYLAPAAEAKGCLVKSFPSPVSAGNYARKNLKSGALVLVKGSQNGVFSEEAVKLFLKNKSDASKLVRQSPAWMKAKSKQFNLD